MLEDETTIPECEKGKVPSKEQILIQIWSYFMGLSFSYFLRYDVKLKNILWNVAEDMLQVILGAQCSPEERLRSYEAWHNEAVALSNTLRDYFDLDVMLTIEFENSH